MNFWSLGMLDLWIGKMMLVLFIRSFAGRFVPMSLAIRWPH